MPTLGDTERCFPLNGDEVHPEICGIANIIETYRAQSQHIELSDEINFEYVLAKFRRLLSDTAL